jgi:hypothetical protein
MKGQFQIKDFVRLTLGCTCPDQVFEQIEDRQVSSAVSPHSRSITIGNRLLVYIWKVKGSDNLGENFYAMLAAGRRERDARGLNRFRAVLAIDTDRHQVENEVHQYFSASPDRDDRMHLHVVDAAALETI